MTAQRPPASSDTPGSSPLYGRERERATLTNSLKAMLQGRGSLILIGGEAGIGKTALVTWFIGDAADAGALVLNGYCYDLTATPAYGPWSAIADGYQADDSLPEVPELLQHGTSMDAITNQAELFTVARDFLRSAADARPLLLVLEDMHWCDAESLNLLRYLARQLMDQRILIVATYRDDEVTREHHLFQLLPVLVREADAERIDLRPLTEADVSNLVRDRYHLGRSDLTRLGAYLQEHGEGNPLFTRELLRTLEEQGHLQQDASSWVLRDVRNVPVPRFLRQVIERRLERLNPEQRAILEVAAVIGQEVPLDLWQGIAKASDQTINATMEQSVEAHIIAESPRRVSVVFTHALIREALYTGIVLPRRRKLHQEIAEALLRDPAPDPDAVAYHLDQAGDERAIDWLIEAGERSQRAFAWLTASERFEQAASLLEGDLHRSSEQGWLLYRAGRLLRYLDLARAIGYLEQAERVGKESGDRALAAYALVDRSSIYSHAGDYRKMLEAARAGVDSLKALTSADFAAGHVIDDWVADIAPSARTQSERDDSRANRSPVLNPRREILVGALEATGHLEESISEGEPYFERLATVSDPDQNQLSSIADLALSLGSSYSRLGEPEVARKYLSTARDAAKQLDHQITMASVAFSMLDELYLPYWTTHLDERRHLVSQIRENEHRAHGRMIPDYVDSAGDFPLALLEGRWSEIKLERRAETIETAAFLRRRAELTLGRLARETGDVEAAWHYFSRLMPMGTYTEPGSTMFAFCLEAQQLAAGLAMDAGDLEAALRWIDAHDRWLGWSKSVLGCSEGELLWARYHRLTGEVTRSRTHAKHALELATDPEQPLALIAARRFLGELDTNLRRFVSAEEYLQESLSLAEECAAPFERAQTLLSLAELRSATGDINGATSFISQVRSICEPLCARRTLDRADALESALTSQTRGAETPAGLTPREVEVLYLITQGKSDRQIAAELFISHHTVMRHVSHILGKLGVESRAAAAAEAVRRGLDSSR